MSIMTHVDISESRADVLHPYDILDHTVIHHRIWIQKRAGDMYKRCVLGPILNISELGFMVSKMGCHCQPSGGLHLKVPISDTIGLETRSVVKKRVVELQCSQLHRDCTLLEEKFTSISRLVLHKRM